MRRLTATGRIDTLRAPEGDLQLALTRSRIREWTLDSVFGRGSVQISAYIDQIAASYLGERIVVGLAFAQTLYLLPISLFGMAISVAELPAMSSALGDDEARAKQLQDRLRSSLRRVVEELLKRGAPGRRVGPGHAMSTVRRGNAGFSSHSPPAAFRKRR